MTQPTISTSRINNTVFSPLTIRHAIQEPLRYLFSRVGPPELRYSNDPEQTKIVIGTKNDKTADTVTQHKPRLLVSVGAYTFNRSGLTDNMSEQQPFTLTGGRLDSKFTLMVSGQSTILIESEEEGTTLLLADMASNFVTWSSQLICDTFGFKNFGYPLTVSNCEMDTEDTEKYSVTIGIPWIFESSWALKEDALQLREFFLNITAT